MIFILKTLKSIRNVYKRLQNKKKIKFVTILLLLNKCNILKKYIKKYIKYNEVTFKYIL